MDPAERQQGADDTLIGGQQVPLDTGLLVDRHTPAVLVHDAEAVLRFRMSFFSRNEVVPERQLVIQVDAKAVAVEQSHAVAGIRISAIGQLLPFAQSCRVIGGRICFPALLKIARPGGNGEQ